jgi:hypothetical protein
MEWGHPGVLGFPASVLLLSFIDSVGFLLCIKGTKNDNGPESNPGLSFEIVRNKNYFKPTLSKKQKEALYSTYRGYLIHQATLSVNTRIVYSKPSGNVIIQKETDGTWSLHLDALYEACIKLFQDQEQEIKQRSS